MSDDNAQPREEPLGSTGKKMQELRKAVRECPKCKSALRSDGTCGNSMCPNYNKLV